MRVDAVCVDVEAVETRQHRVNTRSVGYPAHTEFSNLSWNVQFRTDNNPQIGSTVQYLSSIRLTSLHDRSFSNFGTGTK